METLFVTARFSFMSPVSLVVYTHSPSQTPPFLVSNDVNLRLLLNPSNQKAEAETLPQTKQNKTKESFPSIL